MTPKFNLYKIKEQPRSVVIENISQIEILREIKYDKFG